MKSLLLSVILVFGCSSLQAQASFSIGPYHEYAFVDQVDPYSYVQHYIDNTATSNGLQSRLDGLGNFSLQNRIVYRSSTYTGSFFQDVFFPPGSTSIYEEHQQVIASIAMSHLLRYGVPIGKIEPFLNAGFDFQQQLFYKDRLGEYHYPESAEDMITISGQFSAGLCFHVTNRLDLDMEYLNRWRLIGDDYYFKAHSWALAGSIGYRLSN